MQAKPILNIDKFSGMSDQGGIYYLDGFSVEKENGLTSLDEKYRTREVLSNETSGFTSLAVDALAYVYPLSNSSSPYTLMMGSDGHFAIDGSAGVVTDGRLDNAHEAVIGKPDLFVLPTGNIMFSQQRYMGLIIRGQVKTGSSTSLILDTDDRNLVTLGAAVGGGDILYNIKTGEKHTTISITDEGAGTKNGINFSAGGANTENDEFMLFVTKKYDFGTTQIFSSQPPQTYWQRPIRQWGVGSTTKYFTLNGNYLSLFTADETLWEANHAAGTTYVDDTYKQLPNGFQAIAIEVNGVNIIVSAYDDKGAGYLLLWDGFSSGWNSVTAIDVAPLALEPYRDGWVYFAGGTVYYTDGRNVTKLGAVPDSTGIGVDVNCYSHNSIAQLNDDFYFCISSNNLANLNRTNRGILVFNKNFGFSYYDCKVNGVGFANPTCIYVKSNASVTSQYQPYNDIEIGAKSPDGTESSLCNLDTYTAETDVNFYRSCVYLLDFKQEQKISEVWLNLKNTTKKLAENQKSKVADIRVNVGDGANDIITNIAIDSNTTSTMTNSGGASSPGVVGYEIELLDGDNAGQRSFISSIDDPGTGSEVWNTSVGALSTNPTTVRMWGLKSQEQKTVNLSDMNKPVRFKTNFIGSKMYLEVLVRGNTNAFPVSIMGIQLF